jgi:hypothetical protein
MIEDLRAAEALVDRVFYAADLGSGQQLDAKWVAGLVLITDVLLRADEFTRERLIRGLPQELRAALAGLATLPG